MNTANDLALIIRSHFPIVTIETNEERRTLGVIENACNLEGWPCFTWTIANGVRRLGRPNTIPETREFQQALRHIFVTVQTGVYVLLDAHPYLVDPVNVRLIKEIAQDYEKTARTLVFVSPAIELPSDLQRMSAKFELALPDRARIWEMIAAEMKRCEQDGRGPVKGYKEAVHALVEHLTGLCEDDAQRLVRQAVGDDCAITFEDVSRTLKLKRELVGDTGLLDCELDTGNFADVAGLEQLKRWLDVRRYAFDAPDADASDAPKGILLLGVQGGGKSLAAKAVAGTWALPLLRLDFGVLYNKFYGETERNLREALKHVEAMSPCVLWIDEIEKALASDTGGSTDGGVSRRILGTLLTWMAERKCRVFMVATANDVTQLPPELIRKGRFDEIFFVDLPKPATRAEIARIHLKKRKLDPAAFDVTRLAESTDGFSGAEIEQAIVAAIYEARAQKRAPTTADVEAEAQRTRPLSVVMAEQIAALRHWAASRTVSAD